MRRFHCSHTRLDRKHLLETPESLPFKPSESSSMFLGLQETLATLALLPLRCTEPDKHNSGTRELSVTLQQPCR